MLRPQRGQMRCMNKPCFADRQKIRGTKFWPVLIFAFFVFLAFLLFMIQKKKLPQTFSPQNFTPLWKLYTNINCFSQCKIVLADVPIYLKRLFRTGEKRN